jgi:hypothetical protein
MPPEGSLSIEYADGRREQVALDRARLRVGRSKDNEVVIQDEDASRQHAEILRDETGIQILDLGSANGTNVDGVRLLPGYPQALADGSVVQIGSVRMVLRLGETERPTVVRAAAPQADRLLTNLLATPIEPPAPPAQAPPPQQPPQPPVRAIGQLQLEIQPAEHELSAGDAVLLVASVTNRATVVDQIDIVVEGLPPEWVTITPPSHNLLPNSQGDSQITIQVPRRPSSAAGPKAFRVTARSKQRPVDRVGQPAKLNILPYAQFKFELLDPRVRTAWTQGIYTLQISNEGNREQEFAFVGRNDENAFRFRVEPEPFVVAPGEVRQARLRATLRLLRWIGEPKTYTFDVRAAAVDTSEPPQLAAGRLIQRPPLPRWLLLALLALLLLTLLCCAGYLALAYAPRVIARIFPTPTPTLLPLPLPGVSPEPTSDSGFPFPPFFPDDDTGTAAPGAAGTSPPEQPAQVVPDVAGTVAALQAQFNTAVAAQNATFAQTAEALRNASAEERAEFARQVVQIQTQQALVFGQTAAAIIGNAQQTQQAAAGTMSALSQAAAAEASARALANAQLTAQAATAIAQGTSAADIARTATALAGIDQTATAGAQTQAALNQTATAQVAGNSQTQTTQAERFVQTQTAQSIHATQTALAIPTPTPTATPTPSPSPTITPTPTPTPLAHRVLDFNAVSGARQPLNGREFAVSHDVILCFYEPEEATPTITATIAVTDIIEEGGGSPILVPRSIEAGGIEIAQAGEFADCGIDDENDIDPERFGDLESRQPVLYPSGAEGSPAAALTADQGSNEFLPFSIGVVDFQRPVRDVVITAWAPMNPSTNYFYRLSAFDANNALIARYDTDPLQVPALQQLPIRNSQRPIRRVVVDTLNNRDGVLDDDQPVFITSIAFNYSAP